MSSTQRALQRELVVWMSCAFRRFCGVTVSAHGVQGAHGVLDAHRILGAHRVLGARRVLDARKVLCRDPFTLL